MLALLLFNVGGYQLLFQYFIYQSDHSITDQINNNRYKPADLVEIKIPVHLNIQDWNDFEPVSGQVKIKKDCYNYAELKLTRDTMYLMCIPNFNKALLINANVLYAKAVNDIPLNKKGHDTDAKKVNTLSEYDLHMFKYDHSAFATSLNPTYRPVSLILDRPYIESPGKPPNFIG